jgi:hypothetical protein
LTGASETASRARNSGASVRPMSGSAEAPTAVARRSARAAKCGRLGSQSGTAETSPTQRSLGRSASLRTQSPPPSLIFSTTLLLRDTRVTSHPASRNNGATKPPATRPAPISRQRGALTSNSPRLAGHWNREFPVSPSLRRVRRCIRRAGGPPRVPPCSQGSS